MPRLAEHRFITGQYNFRRKKDGPMESVPLYSYETTGKHGKLYDFMVLDGKKYVRTNMGPWSNLILDWASIHYELERRFS